MRKGIFIILIGIISGLAANYLLPSCDNFVCTYVNLIKFTFVFGVSIPSLLIGIHYTLEPNAPKIGIFHLTGLTKVVVLITLAVGLLMLIWAFAYWASMR